MTRGEYVYELLRYSNARLVLTCRERGLRNMAIPPEARLPDNFGEPHVQALAAHLREIWGTRPKGWTPEGEDPQTGDWVRYPDDPDALIEVLDRYATQLADREVWRRMRGSTGSVAA